MDRMELYGNGPAELARRLAGLGRARRVWRLIRSGVDPFAADSLADGAARRLQETCLDLDARVAGRHVAADGTAKLLVRLADGRAVETVVIPGRARTTVCVSTQVGCGRDCGFCVTARMGLARSLSVAEIVGQVILARRDGRERDLPPARNVVFMGMGEPLDNLDATLRSIDILADHGALAIAPRHITLSTVGTSPAAVRRLAETGARIAWSIHAVDDGLRHRLIPSVRHPMESLREAFVDVTVRRGRPLFVEMTMLDGVNDGPGHAAALAAFLRPFRPDVRVNLLPMNPGREGYRASPPDRVGAFREHLRARGYFCVVRRPRGADRAAACGQLAVPAAMDAPAGGA